MTMNTTLLTRILNAGQISRMSAKIRSKRIHEKLIFGAELVIRLTRKLVEYRLEQHRTECVSKKQFVSEKNHMIFNVLFVKKLSLPPAYPGR